MSAIASLRLRLARWMAEASVSRLLATTIGMLFALAAIAIGLALIANGQLAGSRTQLVEQVGPALRSSLALENALVNEETGVRGYLIAGRREFLAPYAAGLAAESAAYAALRARKQAIGPQVVRDAIAVRSDAEAWRRRFVGRALASHRLTRRQAVALGLQGKRLFDRVRVSLGRLNAAVLRKDLATRRHVYRAAGELELLLVLAAVLVLGGVLGAWLVLRATITRPLLRLGSEARRVSAGEFGAPLEIAAGPREISEVGAEIESMRERIVQELASLEATHRQVERQARELSRSNAELEQFAYVASHDLQEPLRKIASFCEALQRRYHGRLDARADQYIEFAVDGAKRMQTLINDLLAFSRVGRSERPLQLLPLSDALEAARSALAGRIEQTGAEISVLSELPSVKGDRTLLSSLFQNLLSNAMKFRGPVAPRVRIEARERGQEWEISCADNGIGVQAEDAERIFLVFERMHSRQAYEGSGIGLALARKIVEHHGGRMWLDTDYSGGACFRFTLPVAGEEETSTEDAHADGDEQASAQLTGATDAKLGASPLARPLGAGRVRGEQARMGD